MVRKFNNPLPDEFYYGSGFDDVFLRHRFVTKVFAILFIQLLITTGLICLFIYEPNCKKFASENWIMLICCAIAGVIVYMVLVCVPVARRKVPINYILTLLLTLLNGYTCGALSSRYKTYVVLITIAATCGLCLLVSMIALIPCIDLTSWGIYLVIASIVLMSFGIIIMILAFFMRIKILFLVYSGIATLLFSMFLIYDIQLIIGGRKYEICCDEYILGAISLYIDIIIIFQSMLALIGCASN